MQKDGGDRRGDFDAIQKARQSGDTATARKLMAEQRTKMEAHLTAHTAAIRAILTPDQQKQLDANAAELKNHPMQFGRGRRGGKLEPPQPSAVQPSRCRQALPITTCPPRP